MSRKSLTRAALALGVPSIHLLRAMQSSCKRKVCNKLLLKGTTSLKAIAVGLTTVDTRGDVQGEKSMEHYYTSREAQQQLGIHVGAFYYLIQTGKIKRLTPTGKKQGFYSKHQIERLAKERLMCMTGEEEPGTTFMKATLDDIHEEYELATLMLNGSVGYGIPVYEAWLRKNPETNFIVRDQGRLVAFMHVLPVKQEIIKRWMKGEIREWEISAEDVLPYTPRSPVECIIMCMVTTPDVDKRKRRQYGVRLMRGYLHFLHDLAEQDITITRFYAIGATPGGIAILRQAKFEERGHVGKRVVFELNPLTSDIRIAKAYRAVLKHYNMAMA